MNTITKQEMFSILNDRIMHSSMPIVVTFKTKFSTIGIDAQPANCSINNNSSEVTIEYDGIMIGTKVDDVVNVYEEHDISPSLVYSINSETDIAFVEAS